jgi:hypothetical protein
MYLPGFVRNGVLLLLQNYCQLAFKDKIHPAIRDIFGYNSHPLAGCRQALMTRITVRTIPTARIYFEKLPLKINKPPVYVAGGYSSALKCRGTGSLTVYLNTRY